MKGAHLLIVTSLMAAVSGCTLAPRYIRPEATAPAAWPEGAAYADSAAEIGLPAVATLDPEMFFPDTRLQRVLALARQHSLDLRLATLNVNRVRAYYKIQRAELIPSLGASASATRHRTPADLSMTGTEYTSEDYDAHVGVTAWEIDLFGRVRSEKNQALQQYLASEEGRRGAELSLVTAVCQSWLALAATREQRALADSTLQAQRGIFEMMAQTYDVGLATKLDLRRAQMQVDAAALALSDLIRREAEGRNALELLVGIPVPEDLLPMGLYGIDPPRAIAAGLASEVLLGRPDVMAAEHQLMAANAYLGVARAAFFPRISLTALLGTASAALSGLFESGSGTWTFAGAAALPLFDLRTHGALQASQADREILVTRYQMTIQTAFRETADALATRGTVGHEVTVQASLAEAAGDAYSLARERYAKGIDSYLSVLDAQRTYDAARQGLVSARFAELENRVRLYAVLGGGCVGQIRGQTECLR